ncbi:MAG: hypothetical protein GWP10_07420 [Nitrospiraceae bacterium]|nr:hypothetical protein [Nitrospiraceae bacterium]
MYDDDIKLDIIRDDSYNIDVHRTITVRKYETDIKCDLDAVEDLLGSNYLKHGKEFGCINVCKSEGGVHAMFGQIGDSHITSIGDRSENNVSLIHYLVRNVVKSTMHIDHFCDDGGKLGIIMYGGGNIKDDLVKSMYNDCLGISNLKIVEFDENIIRKLCFERFLEELYDIKFDPAVDKSFGNVHLADYKSKKNQRINHLAPKIREIIDNTDIKIQHFKSKVTQTHAMLNRSYDVKFIIDVNGKIIIEFPKLPWNEGTSSLSAETYLYELAGSIYAEIVTPSLFKHNKQKDLFDF